MDSITQLYITMGIFVSIALGITFFVMAGRDIMFAIFRKFRPKGSDIFMFYPNRHVDRYYKIPNKEGQFKINGGTYLTNPEKVGSLGDKMKQKVEMSEKKRKKKLKKQIERFKKKKEIAQNKLSVLKNAKSPNASSISKIQEYIADLSDKINFLQNKLNLKEQNYFLRRRSAYFYIWNDPVPKDIFEFLSEYDVIQLDNAIARAQSKDRHATQDLEKKLKQLKFFLLIVGAIVLVAAWFALKGSLGIEDIAKNLGVTLTV